MCGGLVELGLATEHEPEEALVALALVVEDGCSHSPSHVVALTLPRELIQHPHDRLNAIAALENLIREMVQLRLHLPVESLQETVCSPSHWNVRGLVPAKDGSLPASEVLPAGPLRWV